MHYLLINLLILIMAAQVKSRYEPTWKSLDTRPLPAWYDDVKFGIFIHWGVFSVPGYCSEWFWYFWKNDLLGCLDFMKKNYPPNFSYTDFATKFTAELYDPDHWADVFEASGAKYIVFTAKHHEGFTNWPSKVSSNWNSMDVGPKRDLVGELEKAIRKKGMYFGLYHSLSEWYHPLFLADEANNFTTRYFPDSKSIPELYELVHNYKPDIIWSDGGVGGINYWKSLEFMAWLYNDSPVKDTVITNDRWGSEHCQHGDFWTCHDRFNPGYAMPHKWENCITIDVGSWGYRRNAELSTYHRIDRLIKNLVETVSCGGNLLMNVGPTHDGRIIPIFEERLRQVGQWLKVNGEAIYGTKPWTHQNDTATQHVWYTAKNLTNGTRVVYAITLKWPTTSFFRLGVPVASSRTHVTLLGYPEPFKYSQVASQGLVIAVPVIPFYDMPCMWAWVFRLTNLKNM